MRILVLAALAFAACHPAPAPTRLDMAGPVSGVCLSNPRVTTGDVCPGMFTAEGWICARCEGGETGCVTTDFVWCVYDCNDTACTKQQGKR